MSATYLPYEINVFLSDGNIATKRFLTVQCATEYFAAFADGAHVISMDLTYEKYDPNAPLSSDV